jgi:biopolymer transport protein ExbB
VTSSDSTTEADDWWDTAWAYRVTLTIAPQQPAEDLDSFPILVHLPAETFVPTHFDNPAIDARFVDGDTVLDHEIELSSPDLVFWVRIPQIPAGTTSQTIHMYYGNRAAPDVSNGPAVWQDGYVGVYHFVDGSDASGMAGTGQLTETTPVAGRLGCALDFTGSDASGMVISGPGALQNLFATGGTISVMLELDDYGGNGQGRLVEKAAGIGSEDGWIFNVDDFNAVDQPETDTIRLTRGYSGTNNGAIWEASSGSLPNDGAWHYVTVRYDEDDTAPEFWVDGAAVATVVGAAPAGTIDSESFSDVQVGNTVLGENRAFDGRLDELRFSDVSRSDVWLDVQYLSVSDQLVTVGPEETAP